jgi:hypothetical protein
LEVGGDDFEVVIDEVLKEEGDTGFVVHVVVPSYSWVYSWHRTIGSRGACLLTVFVIEDKVEGWDGGVVTDLGHCSGVIGWERGEAWLRAEVFFQPLELLLGQGW